MENETKINKTSRKLETRETEARPKAWVPPSSLEAPQPDEGWHHRWVRYEYRGIPDDKNVNGRLRQGYDFVKSDTYGDRLDIPAIADGKFKGVIGIGGLILMRCPIETKKQRDAYFKSQTEGQMQSVDNDLMKDEHPNMPIHRERQSRVSFGGPKPTED